MQPILIRAIFSGDPDEVERIVEDDPSEVHKLDEEKRSPLHAAAFMGDASVVRTLLGLGKARVEIKDNRWLTPLHRACRAGAEVREAKSSIFFYYFSPYLVVVDSWPSGCCSATTRTRTRATRTGRPRPMSPPPTMP